MPKKNRDAAKELKAAGFEKQPSKRGKGSHEVWKDKSGKTVTVPTHGEIPTGTWSAIQRQAGLKGTPAKKTDDAEQARRLAGDGVAKPSGQDRGQPRTRRPPGDTAGAAAAEAAAAGSWIAQKDAVARGGRRPTPPVQPTFVMSGRPRTAPTHKPHPIG